MPLCEKCHTGTHNVFEQNRNFANTQYVANCSYPLPNSLLGYWTNPAPYNARDALGWFEPIDANKQLATSWILPPAVLDAAKRFEEFLEEKRALIKDLENDFIRHARHIDEPRIKSSIPRNKLKRWHHQLASIQKHLQSNEAVYNDILFGVQVAISLKANPHENIRHVYFDKKVAFFRTQLASMKCFIERMEAKIALRKRISPSRWSELMNVMWTQSLALRNLNQMYAVVRSEIDQAERKAYGLIANVIPYSDRFCMPWIPPNELSVSLFNPDYIETRTLYPILVPKYIAEQRDAARPREPSRAASGIDLAPEAKEKSIWAVLAEEANKRAEKAKKQKQMAEDASRRAEFVQNQRGPRKDRLHFSERN